MSLKFPGADGRKPSTEARRYVYRCLAETLEADIANGSDWMHEDMEEPDSRRVLAATKRIIAELRKKASR